VEASEAAAIYLSNSSFDLFMRTTITSVKNT